MKMKNEMAYTKGVTASHIKSFGQYFTKYEVADFMCSWACVDADTMLDPAVGNSVFLKYARKHNSNCRLTGFEIDSEILEYFGNPANANIINEDYLLNNWEKKYDAIVCNPPYNRFQAVGNRNEILDAIYAHTGVKYSGYTNLYILFLLKSIYQLSDKGRLAYIIPTEFMNSKYGTAIKQLLIDKKLLRAIINFKNDNEMFFNATTTCCILLLDHDEKEQVCFYNLHSIDELKLDMLKANNSCAIKVDYGQLTASEKWRSFINQENNITYRNLVPISHFCSVSRGIATGANDYFCFSRSKAIIKKIPESCLQKCICRSADVKSPFFTAADYDKLAIADKTVYFLDASVNDYETIKEYIDEGLTIGVNKKYLPSCRNPWYSMEQKAVAPIWVSSACREGIKFVRNLAGTKSLTTFHSIFVNCESADDVNVIFSYFLTPIAQTIIRENRKELGNGLEKFQPNDLNSANMLDISIITDEDRTAIIDIYNEMVLNYKPSLLEDLNVIFASYLQ